MVQRKIIDPAKVNQIRRFLHEIAACAELVGDQNVPVRFEDPIDAIPFKCAVGDGYLVVVGFGIRAVRSVRHGIANGFFPAVRFVKPLFSVLFDDIGVDGAKPAFRS